MAETGFISIKPEISECLDFFNGLDVNKTMIKKKIMASVGTGSKQAVKRGMGKYLHKRSGTLYKSVFSRVYRDGRAVYISNNAKSEKGQRYGFILANNYDINAKTPTGLTFNINGKWFRKHSVHVEGRDWVEPSVNKYVNSADCANRMNKTFQKQVDYWEKRITGRNL